jgi:hypothetical protein|tara:strand:+ start:498 stop:734 length:237 start_codon:yes stop_codon:yes gene_type:complete
MIVKELISLLSEQHPESEVFAWIATKHGHQISKIGDDSRLIGRSTEFPSKDGFVLIPVELKIELFEPWSEQVSDGEYN